MTVCMRLDLCFNKSWVAGFLKGCRAHSRTLPFQREWISLILKLPLLVQFIANNIAFVVRSWRVANYGWGQWLLLCVGKNHVGFYLRYRKGNTIIWLSWAVVVLLLKEGKTKNRCRWIAFHCYCWSRHPFVEFKVSFSSRSAAMHTWSEVIISWK